MSFVMVTVGAAVLLLALRAVGIGMLSEEQLAELESVSCPICRRNLQTIMAVYSLIVGLEKLKVRAANLLDHISLHQTTNKKPRPPMV